MQPINVIEGRWQEGVPVKVQNLTGLAFTEEAGAHTFVITGYDENGTETGFSGTISALILRADNTTVAVDGAISDGKATVTMVSDCYHVAGRFSIAIYVSDGTDSACIYAAVGNVYRTSSDVVIDSGATIPTLAQLQAAYAACITATGNADNALAYLATAESTTTASKAYSVGDFLIYDGKLYQVTAFIASGGTIVTSGSGVNVSETVFGAEVTDVKNAIDSDIKIEDDINGFVNLISRNVSDWEQGRLDTSTGEEKTSDYRIRTKGYFVLKNGKKYNFANLNSDYSIILVAYNSSEVFQSTIRSAINYDFSYTNSTGADLYVRAVIMRYAESADNPLPVREMPLTMWYGYEDGSTLIEKVSELNTEMSSLSSSVTSINETVSKHSSMIRGLDTDLISKATWEQGGYTSISNYSNPSPNTATTRIRAEFSISPGNYSIEIDSSVSAFVWAAFDGSGNSLGYNAGWQTETKTFTLSSGTGLLRIALKKITDADITPNEFINCHLFVRKNGQLIKLSELQNFIASHSDIPVKLKVMTYNIGRFSYGVSPYYLNEDYDEKVGAYKQFFCDEKADIVGLQECNTYLDTDAATGGRASVNETIFDYLYPFHKDQNGFTCLKSKYTLSNTGDGTLTASNRGFVYGEITISGKTIFIMSVHLTPNAGETEEAKRASERQQIIGIMKQHTYAICFGDFNAQTGEDFKDFTDEGLKVANGGYLPIVNTYGGRYSFAEQNPMDNIITTGNILINDSKRLNVFSDLSSDHIPFVAYLTLT